MSYRYAFKHPITQSFLFFTGIISMVGVISSLTHGSLYEGTIPGFFYIAMALTAGLFGFSVNASDENVVWHWFRLPLLKRPYQDLHWEKEGKLFRLHIKSDDKMKATSVLSREKVKL